MALLESVVRSFWATLTEMPQVHAVGQAVPSYSLALDIPQTRTQNKPAVRQSLLHLPHLMCARRRRLPPMYDIANRTHLP
jgi:hypothetical protein